MMQENHINQFSVLDLGAEIASIIDRNKAIFNRSIAYIGKEDMVDVPANKLKQNEHMLNSCMDLQGAMARGDVKQQITVIESIPLSRMVFETVIVNWLNKVKSYPELVIQETKLRVSGKKSYAITTELYNKEKEWGLNPSTSYGTIKFVRVRMEAIRRIYDRIARAYARVVLKMAKKQSSLTDFVLDSYQNGNLGLMRAISCYDPVSNVRFPGYAKWWIRQRMLLCIKEEANTIKISSSIWQHYAKLEACRLKIDSTQASNITVEDIAKSAGYELAYAENIYNFVKASQVKSLEYKMSSDGFTLMVMASGTSEDPCILLDEQYYEDSDTDNNSEENNQNVAKMLDTLPLNTRKLVCLQYGLLDSLKQNLDPVAVETERNRQIAASLS
jgi:RNA polymerase sigma factor (sigma-70 family)